MERKDQALLLNLKAARWYITNELGIWDTIHASGIELNSADTQIMEGLTKIQSDLDNMIDDFKSVEAWKQLTTKV